MSKIKLNFTPDELRLIAKIQEKLKLMRPGIIITKMGISRQSYYNFVRFKPKANYYRFFSSDTINKFAKMLDLK